MTSGKHLTERGEGSTRVTETRAVSVSIEMLLAYPCTHLHCFDTVQGPKMYSLKWKNTLCFTEQSTHRCENGAEAATEHMAALPDPLGMALAAEQTWLCHDPQ